MKIELHCHTSRYSACAVSTPHEMMAALIKAGYEAVFITEHDKLWSPQEIADLQAEFAAILIMPGVELALAGDASQHLLVLGTHDTEFLRLPRPSDVIARAREGGCLTVLAHPFRWRGGDAMLQDGVLPDAIEHMTCNQERTAARESAEAAKRLGIPLVNASDAHSTEMINRYWIETDRPVASAAELREVIVAGAYKNCGGQRGLF